MVSSGDLVVAAVSGGPDSMCLLDVLASMAGDLGIRLHVAHLNHHMRPEAAGDARMVQDFSNSLGVPCTVGDADVLAVARGLGVGVEEAGREARYKFLRQVKEELGAQRIALGHNLNDQAETVLMRLLRGAGTQGLAGIPPVNGDVIRPIIDVPRKLTEEYCVERNIPTMLDVYNLDPKYTRNAVRLEVLPDLAERFNPSLVGTLSQVATVMRWDADFLGSVAKEAFLGISTKQARMTLVDRQALDALPPALSSRVLESAWRECSLSEANLPLERVQELLWSAENTISLPEGVIAEKTGDALRFYPKPPVGIELVLQVPGQTEVPELGISVSARTVQGPGPLLAARARQSGGAPDGYPPWLAEPVARLDYNKIRGSLTLRTRREGDRFRPLGMGGSEQKLQDFLVQRKVPKFYRDFVPVLSSAADIVWVAGLRLSEEFKVVDSTGCMLEVEVRPYLRCSRNYATIWRSCPTSGRVYS